MAVSGYLGIKNNGYPKFVNDTFRHFCARKTQIVLSLFHMHIRMENDDFVSLIMNEVKEHKYLDISDDDANMFKPVLFELFCNVQEVVIDAVGYAFNLRRMAKFIVSKSLQRMTIWGQWLKDAFTDCVKLSLNNQGWRAAYDCTNRKLELVRQ